MRNFLQTIIISALLLAPASSAQAQITFGIRIGEPPPERAYRVPRQPALDYEWIEGYYYVVGSRYRWHDGYWTRPPYPGAYWVAPYYSHGRYFPGQWEGSRGIVAHDHRWDRSPQRDERRAPRPNNRGNGRGNGRR